MPTDLPDALLRDMRERCGCFVHDDEAVCLCNLLRPVYEQLAEAQEKAALWDAVDGLQYDACFTGDCPHEKAVDCLTYLCATVPPLFGSVPVRDSMPSEMIGEVEVHALAKEANGLALQVAGERDRRVAWQKRALKAEHARDNARAENAVLLGNETHAMEAEAAIDRVRAWANTTQHGSAAAEVLRALDAPGEAQDVKP